MDLFRCIILIVLCLIWTALQIIKKPYRIATSDRAGDVTNNVTSQS